jgi:hypothetical protein
MDTPDRRVWGERRPKDRVTLQIILVFRLSLHTPKYLQGRVSVNIYIYTLQQDKCKCKTIGCDLHWIYMPYVWLLTLTCTTLLHTQLKGDA